MYLHKSLSDKYPTWNKERKSFSDKLRNMQTMLKDDPDSFHKKFPGIQENSSGSSTDSNDDGSSEKDDDSSTEVLSSSCDESDGSDDSESSMSSSDGRNASANDADANNK